MNKRRWRLCWVFSAPWLSKWVCRCGLGWGLILMLQHKRESECEERIYPWFLEWFTQEVQYQENGNIMLMSWGRQRQCWHRGMMGFWWRKREGGGFSVSEEEWNQDGVTLLFPFRLSGMSFTQLWEMKSNDMLFVLQSKSAILSSEVALDLTKTKQWRRKRRAIAGGRGARSGRCDWVAATLDESSSLTWQSFK